MKTKYEELVFDRTRRMLSVFEGESIGSIRVVVDAALCAELASIDRDAIAVIEAMLRYRNEMRGGLPQRVEDALRKLEGE